MVDTVAGDSTGRVSVNVGMRNSPNVTPPRTPDDSTGSQTSLVWKVSFSGVLEGDEIFPDPIKFGAFPSAVSLAPSPAAKSVRRFPSVRPDFLRNFCVLYFQ